MRGGTPKRERASLMGGFLSIESHPGGGGTRLTAELPLEITPLPRPISTTR